MRTRPSAPVNEEPTVEKAPIPTPPSVRDVTPSLCLSLVEFKGKPRRLTSRYAPAVPCRRRQRDTSPQPCICTLARLRHVYTALSAYATYQVVFVVDGDRPRSLHVLVGFRVNVCVHLVRTGGFVDTQGRYHQVLYGGQCAAGAAGASSASPDKEGRFA